LCTESVMCVVEFSFSSLTRPFRSHSKPKLCFYAKKKILRMCKVTCDANWVQYFCKYWNQFPWGTSTPAIQSNGPLTQVFLGHIKCFWNTEHCQDTQTIFWTLSGNIAILLDHLLDTYKILRKSSGHILETLQMLMKHLMDTQHWRNLVEEIWKISTYIWNTQWNFPTLRRPSGHILWKLEIHLGHSLTILKHWGKTLHPFQKYAKILLVHSLDILQTLKKSFGEHSRNVAHTSETLSGHSLKTHLWTHSGQSFFRS